MSFKNLNTMIEKYNERVPIKSSNCLKIFAQEHVLYLDTCEQTMS